MKGLVYTLDTSIWCTDQRTGRNYLIWPGSQLEFWWSRCIKRIRWTDFVLSKDKTTGLYSNVSLIGYEEWDEAWINDISLKYRRSGMRTRSCFAIISDAHEEERGSASGRGPVTTILSNSWENCCHNFVSQTKQLRGICRAWTLVTSLGKTKDLVPPVRQYLRFTVREPPTGQSGPPISQLEARIRVGHPIHLLLLVNWRA